MTEAMCDVYDCKTAAEAEPMLDLGGRRCARRGRRQRQGTAPRTRDQLEAHGGDRATITEVTRGMSGSLSSSVPGEMPEATRTAVAPTRRGPSRGRRIALGAASAGSPTSA